MGKLKVSGGEGGVSPRLSSLPLAEISEEGGGDRPPPKNLDNFRNNTLRILCISVHPWCNQRSNV